MHIRTSLTFLPLFLCTLFACGGTVTGGSGGGGGGASSSSNGASTSGSGGSGGEGLPGCAMPGELPVSVYVCHPNAVPAGTPPFLKHVYAGPVMVTAVLKAITYECPDGKAFATEGKVAKAPEALIRVIDAAGATLTLGIAAPGFSPSAAVAVGDTLDIDFESAIGGTELHLDEVLRLRIERTGQLLVAVGANDSVGLTLEEGERECFAVDGPSACGMRKVVMQVQGAQGNAVSIPSGASAEIDGLLVTNARYVEYHDIPGNPCEIGLPVEYLVSAVPIP